MSALRTLLRHLGTRYGIGVGLLVAVVMVVVIARFLPHSDVPPVVSDGAPVPSAAAGSSLPQLPSASPAGPLLHSPEPPRVKAGTASPQRVAREFADAWLRHTGGSAASWLHGVSTFSTPALLAQLSETDPANVPASRITHDPHVVDNTADNCVVDIPMDTGTLSLTMNTVSGRWLVDGVDWARSS
jgi:hypothetical protein